MARLARLESDVGEIKSAVVQITVALLNLTERVDNLTERVDNVTERVDHLTERVDHLTERVDAGHRAMVERLDRLIEVTIEERTHGYSRLREFERRLERLEERAGIT